MFSCSPGILYTPEASPRCTRFVFGTRTKGKDDSSICVRRVETLEDVTKIHSAVEAGGHTHRILANNERLFAIIGKKVVVVI